MESQPGYRADIDGLRALAVLPVVLYHSGVSAFGGGYIGVDVFFVISGAVIALSIQRDLMAGRFTIAGFYERRARRILPALTLVLLATATASVFIAPPVYFEPFANSLAFTAGFFSNIYFWRNSGYFGSESPFLPLLHTWSLGIEEQYYIAAPLLLLVIFTLLRRRWALVALAPPPQMPSPVGRETVAAAGLALIVAPIFLYTQNTPFPGLTALAPAFGAALLIHVGAARDQTLASRAFSWRPLVAIGLISYALYLVHWPFLVFASFVLMRPLTPPEIAIAIAVCFLISAALYRWVERPLRHAPAPRRVVFALALAAIAATAAVGVLSPRLNRMLYANTPEGAFHFDWSGADAALGTGTCLLSDGYQTYRDWRADRCVRATGSGPDILLWGDSFAAHYAPGIEATGGRATGRVIQYTLQGCPPVRIPDAPRECRAFVEHAFDMIAREHVRRVVLAANWLEYGPDPVARIGPTLAALRRANVEVTLIGQSPHFYLPPFLIAARRGEAKAPDFAAQTDPRAMAINRVLAANAAATGARFVDPVTHLCNGDLCPVRENDVELYFDYGHFTPAGSTRAVRSYFPHLESAQN